MLARFQGAEHRVVRKHGRHWVKASGQRLAEQRDIRLDALVLFGEQLAVRPSPVWISSRISITSCAVQSSRTSVK